MNMIVFDNVELSIQRMKNSFICNLWSWSRVFVYEGQSIPWLESHLFWLV